jgi:hypothetical protein
VSVEHDNNFRVNCVKSQDCRRAIAGEARTKAGNDTYLNSEIKFFLENDGEKIDKIKFQIKF